MAGITTDQLLGMMSPESVLSDQDVTPELDVEAQKREPLNAGWSRLVTAALERESEVIGYFKNGFKDTTVSNINYNPIERLEREKKSLFDRKLNISPKDVAYADSDEEFDEVISRKEREAENNQVIEEAGWYGTFAQMGAGLVSPTTAVAGLGVIASASKLGTIAKTGLASGAIGSASIGAQELALQAQQYDRSWQESAAATAGAFVLAGVLGGTAGALVGRTERQIGEAQIASIVKDTKMEPIVNDKGEITGVFGQDSVGAAKVNEQVQLIRERTAEGLADVSEGAIKFLSMKGVGLAGPTIESALGKAPTTRKFGQSMFEAGGLTRNKNKEGIANFEAMESKMEIRNRELYEVNTKIDDVVVESKLTSGQRYDDVSKDVQEAFFKGGSSVNPHAQKILGILQPMIAKVTKGLQELDALKIKDTAKEFENVIPVRWNQEAIAAKQHELENLVTSKLMNENKALELDDAAYKAFKIVEDLKIHGEKSKYSSALDIEPKTSDVEFKLKDTDLETFKPYINQDGIGNALDYINKGNKVIEFNQAIKRAGYRDFKDVLKSAENELNTLKNVDKLSQKQIAAELQNIKDYAAIMLGKFGVSSKADGFLASFRKYQVLTLLGGVTVSSLPDLAMPVFVHGLGRTFFDGYLPILRDFAAAKASKSELQDFSVAVDHQMNSTFRALTDPEFELTARQPGRVERVLDKATQVQHKITLMQGWNNFHKGLSGRISEARTLRSIKKLVDGKISDKERTRLASLGIDESTAKRINSSFEKYGAEHGGSYITNHKLWDPKLADTFGQAVLKDVNSTIITPGRGDIPKVVQKSQLAKTIFQFKSFSSAATNKILISGLQRRDANTLVGVTMLMTLGAMSYVIKEKLKGKEPDLSPQNLAKQGFIKSGLPGLIGDVALSTLPGTNSNRYGSSRDYQTAVGPSFSQMIGTKAQLESLGKNIYKDGKPSEYDIKQVIRMFPYNNLWYIRGLYSLVFGSNDDN